jgi:hypothetical protein
MYTYWYISPLFVGTIINNKYLKDEKSKHRTLGANSRT